MTWKTPIPTDLNKIFCKDHLSQLIFERLLIRARVDNKSGTDYWYSPLVLNRGQAVCGWNELGKFFGVNRKTIKKHLVKLQNEYGVVDYLPTPLGTIVTIKNYGQIVKVDKGVDYPTGQKVDNPLPDKNIIVEPTIETPTKKVDYPKQAKVDTNKNINTNNSKSFKCKSQGSDPVFLSDLTPEQRKEVLYVKWD